MADGGSAGGVSAARQGQFEAFIGMLSRPDLFGGELFDLHALDASDEATRLLADAIEANWIIFGGSAPDATLDVIEAQVRAEAEAADE